MTKNEYSTRMLPKMRWNIRPCHVPYPSKGDSAIFRARIIS